MRTEHEILFEPTPEEILEEDSAMARLFEPNGCIEELTLARVLSRWFPEEFAELSRKILESASAETRDRIRHVYEIEARCAAREKARGKLN